MVPIFAIVVGISLYRGVRGEFVQLKGLGGQEEWSFAHNQIQPPVDLTGAQLPPLVAGSGGIRGCLNVVGGKWVVDFSAGGRNLYLGPFDSKVLATRCEAELRHLRPGWFAGPSGVAVLNGVIGETRINGVTAPADPINAFEAEFIEGGCALHLQRERGPRPVLGFLALWLCGWLVGEILVGWMLLSDLTRFHGPFRSHDSLSAELFMGVWFVGWTLFGLGAAAVFALGLKRQETWKFTNNVITAGRSWHWWSQRRLPIESAVQVRFGPFADPPSVDFISGGLLLHLGPFQTWDLAGEAMGDVERQFPHWDWPGD